MDLRKFLFEQRLTQTQLIRAILRCNYIFYLPDLSRIVNGLKPMSEKQRQKIVKGLLKLGYSKAQVEAIEGLTDGQG